MKFARQLFLENPTTSIDAAARIVDKQCMRSLTKDALAQVRREAALSIASGHAKVIAPAAHAPIVRPRPAFHVQQVPTPHPVSLQRAAQVQAPFNPPRIVAPVPTPVPPKPPAEQPDLKTKMEEYLYEIVEKNPAMGARAVNTKLKEKFGKGMFVPKVAEVVSLARQVAGVAQPPKPEPKAVPVVAPAPVTAKPTNEDGLEAAVLAAARIADKQDISRIIIDIDMDGGVEWRYEQQVVKEVSKKSKL